MKNLSDLFNLREKYKIYQASGRLVRADSAKIVGINNISVLLDNKKCHRENGLKVIRFILNTNGELTFGAEGTAGFDIPAHLNVSNNDKCISGGNLYFDENNEIIGINNKSSDFKPDFNSLLLVLYKLKIENQEFSKKGFFVQEVNSSNSNQKHWFKQFKLHDELLIKSKRELDEITALNYNKITITNNQVNHKQNPNYFANKRPITSLKKQNISRKDYFKKLLVEMKHSEFNAIWSEKGTVLKSTNVISYPKKLHSLGSHNSEFSFDTSIFSDQLEFHKWEGEILQERVNTASKKYFKKLLVEMKPSEFNAIMSEEGTFLKSNNGISYPRKLHSLDSHNSELSFDISIFSNKKEFKKWIREIAKERTHNNFHNTRTQKSSPLFFYERHTSDEHNQISPKYKEWFCGGS